MNTLSEIEIKKIVYKEQPFATLLAIRMGIAYYMTDEVCGYQFAFHVPVTDMGDASFLVQMEAKLLLRWVQKDYAITV